MNAKFLICYFLHIVPDLYDIFMQNIKNFKTVTNSPLTPSRSPSPCCPKVTRHVSVLRSDGPAARVSPRPALASWRRRSWRRSAGRARVSRRRSETGVSSGRRLRPHHVSVWMSSARSCCQTTTVRWIRACC